MRSLPLFVALAGFLGCGEVKPGPGPQPRMPDFGPPGRGFTAAGRKSVSTNFILISATGQATPVSAGRAKSSSGGSHAPGILAGRP